MNGNRPVSVFFLSLLTLCSYGQCFNDGQDKVTSLKAEKVLKYNGFQIVDQQQQFPVIPGDSFAEDIMLNAEPYQDSYLWHSYKFGSGTGNREELKLTGFNKVDFECGAGVTEWKTQTVGGTVHVVGLTKQGLQLCSYVPTEADDYVTSELHEEMIADTLSFTLFKRWNATIRSMEVVIVVALATSNTDLLWYTISENKLHKLGITWPVYKEVTYLQVFKVEDQDKLLVITSPTEFPTLTNAYVYDFILNEDDPSQFWLSQKLKSNGAVSADVCNIGEDVFLALPQPTVGFVQIFRYDSTLKMFRLLQYIISPGVADVQAFRVGFKTFLAIGGNDPAVYCYHNGEFLEEESPLDNISHVERLHPFYVNNYRDDVLLLVETGDSSNPIAMISWTGDGSFKLHDTPSWNVDYPQSEGLCFLTHGLMGASEVFINSTLNILVPCDNSSALFYMEITLVPKLGPLDLEVKQLLKMKAEVQDLLSSQNNILEVTQELLDDLLDKSTDNIVEGAWKLNQVTAVETEHVNPSPDLTWENLTFSEKAWTAEDFLVTPKSLQEELQAVYALLDEMETQLEDAVFLYIEESRLEAKKYFSGTLKVMGKLYFDNIDVEAVNGIPVDSLLQSVVRLDNLQRISGRKTLASLTTEELQVNTINAIDSKKLLFSNEDCEIYGNMVYKKFLNVKGDVALFEGGKIQGMDILPDILGPDTTFNFASFEGIKANSSFVGGNVNECDFSENNLMQFLTKSMNQEVYSALDVKWLRIDKDLIVEKINGMVWSDMLDAAVRLDEDIFLGNISVQEFNSQQDTNIEFLNGLKFPEEYVTSSVSKTITGKKMFEGDVSVKYASSEGHVDSMDLYDVVTLGSDQNLQGKFSFSDVNFSGDIQVDGNIDERFMELLFKYQDLNNSKLVTSNAVFHNLKVLGNVYVQNSITGHPLTDFTGNIVYKDNNHVVLTGQKEFPGDVLVHENIVMNGFINGYDSSDFITHDTEQTILGKKTLSGHVTFKDMEISGSWGKVNVDELLEEVVLLSAPQNIEAGMSFEALETTELNFKQVNYILPNEVATSTNEQVFKSSVNFNSLEADHLEVEGKLLMGRLIVGVNLTDLELRHFSLTQDQTITGDFIVDEGVIEGDLDTDIMNGILLSDWSSQALYRSKDEQIFKGNCIFNELLVTGDIQTAQVDGFHLQDLSKNAIWVNYENSVEGDLIFQNEVILSSLNTKIGVVNELNLEDFFEDAIEKGEDSLEFTGSKTFVNGFSVAMDIDIDTLNGMAASDILRKSNDQDIAGTLIIKEDVVVEKLLNITNSVNGILLQDLQQGLKPRDFQFQFQGDVEFNEPVAVENLYVKGSVDGRNFNNFIDSVPSTWSNVHLDGFNTFTNKVSFLQNLEVEETVNGLNVSDASQKIIRRNASTKIEGHVTFFNDVISKKLNLYGNLSVGVLYGCSIDEWMENAIFLDEYMFIRGVKTFHSVSSSGNIRIGKLNNINMAQLIFLNKEQVIPMTLTFKKLTATNDVNVGNFVNGYRLKEEFDNTVFLHEAQEISGKKTFLKNITVRGNLNANFVNEWDLKNTVTLETDQTIKGEFTLLSANLKGSLRVLGLVSGIDPMMWQERAVALDEPQEISGKWFVYGNVTFLADVVGKGLLDGVDICQFQKEIDFLSNKTDDVEYKLKMNYTSMCENVQSLHETAVSQIFLLHKYEIVQVMKLPYKVQSMHNFQTFQAHNNHYLAVSYSGDCGGVLFRWNKTASQFYKMDDLSLGHVKKWKTANVGGEVYVVTSGDESSDCENEGENVWHFDGDKFQVVQHFGDLMNDNHSKIDITVNDQSLYLTGKPLNLMPAEEMTSKRARHAPPSDAEYREVQEDVTLAVSGKRFLASFINEEAVISHQSSFLQIFDVTTDKQLFQRLPASKPCCANNIHASEKQSFVAFLEQDCCLRIGEYKGIEGFVESATIDLRGHRLSVLLLPTRKSLTPHHFLLLAVGKDLLIIEAKMLGNPVNIPSINCNP